MASKLSISIGQFSDQGRKSNNEDCCGTFAPQDPSLTLKGIATVIADGVSSSNAGREASEACVQGFLSDYYSTPDSWSVKMAGQKILGALNRWLHGKGHASYGHAHGMLTTISILVIKSTSAYIFHVGDTRIYHFRESDLECLTRDHQTWESNEKSYLSRAMGADVHIDIDYRSLSVQIGDIFVLTTDGVHSFLSHHQLKFLLQENITHPEQAAQIIAQQALNNGSNDNVTCQVVKIDQLDSHQDDEEFYQQLTRLPFPPPLEVGMILDGYCILREIHASNHTQVYLAEDQATHDKVIIKTPSVNYEDDPQYIELFVHEEWAGRRINNKHVVQISTSNRPKQFLYYVTEYVNGITLRQWMAEHPLPEITDVRAIINQIATGLRAFHRLEMLHQDLKPENIMLDANGVVKLIDFGSTKIAGIAEITTPLERIHLLGTQNYTAPEYLLGLPGTNRSDIFALGIITYELLTGKHPYGNALEKATDQRKINNLTYHPSYHYNPMIPVWLDKSIEKSVNSDPLQRYGLLSEFIHDITKPNETFLKSHHIPLIERNPVAFWRTLAIGLLIFNLTLLITLISRW